MKTSKLLPIAALLVSPLFTQCIAVESGGDNATETHTRRIESAEGKSRPAVIGKAPEVEEEKPATGPVSQKVIDDCLAALRKQVGDRKMKVLNSRRGETSFIIDVEVTGAEKPWRCYHDGTKCTGTEYQGEG